MSELSIRVRRLQDNGSTFRATPDTLYLGGMRSAKVDTLRFELPEEWAGCAVTLHVQRLSGTLPDPQILDENNCVVVDRRWTLEKQGMWMLMAVSEDGYVAMTKPAQYTCYETIDTDSTTETIDPSVYEQFVNLVVKSRNEAVSSAEQAKASENNAGLSASRAATSEEHSKASEEASKASEEASARSQVAAKASQDAAATSEANALKYSQEAGAKAGTDKTLAIEDAPADAKKTGEELALRYTKELVDALLAQHKTDTLLAAYPVGSLYMSADATSPAGLFGGTWEQIKDKFILAAGDTYAAGSTGGEASHTLTINEIPSHGRHLLTNDENLSGVGNYVGYLDVAEFTSYGKNGRGWNCRAENEMYPAGKLVGGSRSHNNLPPYTTKYIWQRIE